MGRRILLLFIGTMLVLAQDLSAQNLDSLRGIWADASMPDSTRFKAFNDLIWDGYLFSDPDSAYELGVQMEEQAKAKNLRRFVAVAIDCQAASWYARGQFAKALALFEQSKAVYAAIGDRDGLADVITNIATMHSFMGAKEKAIDLYEEGLAMHLEQNDSVSIANDLNSIGTIHMMRGDHLRAVDFFSRSLVIQRRLGNERGAASTIINLGAIYMSQGDYQIALEHYANAVRMAVALKDDHQRAKALLEMGACHQELGNRAGAMDHFQQCLELRTAMDDQHGMSTALNKIGELLRLERELEQAIAVFERSAAIADEHESPYNEGTALTGLGNALLDANKSNEALKAARAALPLAVEAEELSLHRDAADLAYRALKRLGKGNEAMAMLELSHALNDSLMREENQRAILRHEFAYTYEQQALADSLRHQAETHRLNMAHRDRRNWMAGGLALLAVIILALWSRVRYMRRANAKVLAAQQQVLALERQREAELVRTRIARDIHDDMGGSITKIGLLSAEAQRLITNDTAAAGTTLSRIGEVSRELTASLQEVVSAVDPRSDDSAAVVAQARVIAARLLENSGVQTDLHFAHHGEPFNIDPTFKRDLLLFLKEAITNALKHAGATRVIIHLTAEGSMFKLTVADDGKGFDPERLMQGNGLRNMRERAAQINAAVSFHSSPGQGARIELHGAIRRSPILHM
ncbi:MAG: sensor histidine kinase [Flavobacteriales bacterium]